MKNIGAILSIFISVVVIVGLAVLYRRNRYIIQEGELKGDQAIDSTNITGTWDSKSDEVISKLHPKARKPFTDFINDLNKQGIKYRLYSGNRTFEEQAYLYGKGRTVTDLAYEGIDAKYSSPTQKIVTNAKPGSSYHNYGLAADGVEIKDGVALWNNPNQLKIVTTGHKYGLNWGGDFPKLKDTPHFEINTFGTVNQLLAIYNANKIDTNGYIIV